MHRFSYSAYQAAAAEGATQAELLVLVYNNLAKDLLKAAGAVREGSIERRCAAAKHALLLLGHLESWASETGEAALDLSLQTFYRMLRERVMRMQAAPVSAEFEQLADLVLETSAAWQTVQQRARSTDRAALDESGARSAVSFLA